VSEDVEVGAWEELGVKNLRKIESSTVLSRGRSKGIRVNFPQNSQGEHSNLNKTPQAVATTK
jgi:hypothetical protein